MAWRLGWVQMAHLREWRSMEGGGSGGVFIGGPLAWALFGVRSFCGLWGGGALVALRSFSGSLGFPVTDFVAAPRQTSNVRLARVNLSVNTKSTG